MTTPEKQQSEAITDADRFVFEHTHHGAMIEIELKAMNGGCKSIDWWRKEIDAAIAQEGWKG